MARCQWVGQLVCGGGRGRGDTLARLALFFSPPRVFAGDVGGVCQGCSKMAACLCLWLPCGFSSRARCHLLQRDGLLRDAARPARPGALPRRAG
jgi:hypothetical protein